MPKEMVSFAPHTLCFAEYEDQPLEKGQIRVRVEYASPKHGTELHVRNFDPDEPYSYFDSDTKCFITVPNEDGLKKTPPEFRPGNMWVGRVAEVGSGVSDFSIGERVAGYGSLRETHTILVGRENIPGPGACFDVLRVPEEMDWKAALCYDPCQFAFGAVRDSMLRLGDSCLVTGLGAIGLMAAQMAKLQGAKAVFVSDPIEKRRRIALENGADAAFDPAVQDVGLEVKRLTGNLGVDAVIEASGSYPGLQTALRAVAYGGRIAVVGWYRKCTGNFDLGLEAHMNNATIFFSRACSEPNPDYPRWDWRRVNEDCWRLLSTGALRCGNVVEPVVDFEEACEIYLDVVDRHPEKSVKMGVSF